jgi:hypothetical protein
MAVTATGSLAGCPLRGDDVDRPTPTPGRTRTSTEQPTPTPPSTPTATPTDEPTPGNRPVVFLDPKQVTAIKEKLAANAEPWQSGLAKLEASAEEALGTEPRSVADNGPPAGIDDAHKFGTDAPYQEKDGVFSDDINRQDYFAALDMGDWIRTLGTAYALTERSEFGARCVELLHHWFLNPQTRMYPTTKNYGPHTADLRGQNPIELYITIPKMAYGAALVANHDQWKSYEQKPQKRLHSWFRKYLHDAMEAGPRAGTRGDGITRWWILNCAAIAAYLNDERRLQACFDLWRTDGFRDLEPRGTLKFPRWRTRGLYYSMSSIDALALVAEIARHKGVNLYGHEVTVDGTEVTVLEHLYDFHAKFILEPSEWPWSELGGFEDFEREYAASVYELGYSRWAKDAYRAAISTSGRPIYDQRILGWLTATHGNRFEL